MAEEKMVPLYEKIFQSKDGASRAYGIHLLDGKQSELADAFL